MFYKDCIITSFHLHNGFYRNVHYNFYDRRKNLKQGNTARHKSALKRARQNIKRSERNNLIRASVRTALKKVRSAVEKKDSAEAAEALKKTIPMIDKAVSKGVIFKNTGSRKISRLTRLVQKVKAS